MDNFAVIHARRTGNFSVAHFLNYRLSKPRIAGELLLLSVKKRIPLFVNKKQREVIGHLVRLRNSPVTGSHKLDGRLFGLCFFIYTIKPLEATELTPPFFRMAVPAGRDRSP